MRIGIIGTGNIGATAARLLAGAGHEVALGTRRDPADLAELVAKLGPGASAGPQAEAAAAPDAVLVAVPLHAIDDLPADAFATAVVIDANNYYPGRDGRIAELDDGTTTSSELLAARLPGIPVVKAFNTMQSGTLAGQGMPDSPMEDRLAIPLAGDDASAKATVAGLIEAIGFAPVDSGGLADGGRRQQPGAPVYGVEVGPQEAQKLIAQA